jgi:hypothetical protein
MSTMIRLKNADDTISRVLAPRLMDSESLAVHVQTGVLAALSTLKPFIEELWKRFDALEDGETIAGCTTRKEYCEQILNRTPRAVRYMLDGGNNHRQKHTPALPTGETVSPLSPDENDELELPVRKDTEAFAAIDRHRPPYKGRPFRRSLAKCFSKSRLSRNLTVWPDRRPCVSSRNSACTVTAFIGRYGREATRLSLRAMECTARCSDR